MKNIDEKIQSQLKLTTARKELLETLNEYDKPICYEEIKHKISMDKATFYRNIAKFEDEKLINSFESNDKKRYFEIQKAPHAHFICNKCNKIECISLPFFLLENYLIENIIIKGKCPKCICQQ